jgi:PAS domain S-box-containing protein
MTWLDRTWRYSPAIIALALALYLGSRGGIQAAAVWLAMAVLAAAVAYAAERRLALPLRRLGEAAQRLARGERADPLSERGEARRLAHALEAIDARLVALRHESLAQDEARRSAQTDLQAAEERYAAAVSGAEDGLWDWDLRADTVYYSPRWKSMLGLPLDGAGGHPDVWLNRVHADDLPTVQAALDHHLSGQTPTFLVEHRLRREAGDDIWVLARGRAIRSAGGKPVRLVGLITDISVRKRAEEILMGMAEGIASQRGEGFYRALVQSFAKVLQAPAAFLTTCLDERVTRVRTLAFWDGQKFLDAIEYDLPGTPCDTVINQGETCFIDRDLAARFPVEAGFESYLGIPVFDLQHHVIGHLACLGTLPMDDPLPHESIFKVFATRAGIEMEYAAVAGRLAGFQTAATTP